MKVNSIRPDLPYIQGAKINDDKKESSKPSDRLELSEDMKKIDSSVLQKISSGFYNSDDVRKVIVDKILKEI